MQAFAEEGSRVLLKHLINPSGMTSVPKYVCTRCAMVKPEGVGIDTVHCSASHFKINQMFGSLQLPLSGQ